MANKCHKKSKQNKSAATPAPIENTQADAQSINTSPFTQDQCLILGKAYRLILSWQPEPALVSGTENDGQIAKASAAGSLLQERQA